MQGGKGGEMGSGISKGTTQGMKGKRKEGERERERGGKARVCSGKMRLWDSWREKAKENKKGRGCAA